jgi:D-sedoheptulose 7-phosphate isomerase
MDPDRKNLETLLSAHIEEARVAVGTLPRLLPAISDAAELLVRTLKQGGKVLTAGNGGSAAEAMHMAEELSGRYRSNRRSLPGIALTSDGTALTCIANDFGYDEVFARQVEGLGREGDLLVLFSTSGTAPNLARALQQARAGGLRVLALLGRDGGPLAGLSDAEVIVPVQHTERVQEVHQILLHLLLEAVETAFPAPAP